MYLSKQFLNSVVKGFGFATGTLISLHLYTIIFNDEIKKEQEEFQNEQVQVKKQIEKTLENNEEEDQNIGIFCRLFRTYYYYI